MTDETKTDLARLWLEGEEMHVSLVPDAFESPETWGAVMADLARHVAAGLVEDGHNREEVIAAIRDAFLVELDAPHPEE